MASLKFHKVSSLPASCALGDVYYVVGKGIYVCTKEASSGASESVNYTRFSYANNADTNAKGVVSLTDIQGVKVSNATKADSATTAANYANTGTIASKFSTVDDSIDTINGKISKINASVSGKKLTITKPDGSTVDFIDTDTHNKHTVSFTNGNAGDSTGDSVVVVTGVAGSTTGSDTTISASTTRIKVPTLAVTSGLASRISSLETLASTGMQYKGTISSISTTDAYVAGSVYRVVTNKISLATSQSATGSAITAEVGDFIVCSTAGTGTAAKWDVWQANVNNDAYWDTNPPASGQIVVADGNTGKIKTTGFTTGSFDTKGAAADVLGKSGDAAGTATVYGALASAANAQSTANSKEPTSTAVRHTANTAFGSTSKPVYVDSTGAVKECSFTVQTSVPANAKFTDTHYTAAFTVTNGTTTAQTFTQNAAANLAIKGSASGGLTASTSAATGTLTVNVGVASGYAIPSNSQITAWNNKYDSTSFNKDNFDVSGPVSLKWAEWV